MGLDEAVETAVGDVAWERSNVCKVSKRTPPWIKRKGVSFTSKGRPTPF